MAGGVSATDSLHAEALLRRLHLLATLDEQVKAATSCEFLYFHRELLPVLFREMWEKEKKADIVGLQLLINGCTDCEAMLRLAPQVEETDGEAFVKDYREFLVGTVVQEEIVDKLCREVETDLRLAVHTKVSQGEGLERTGTRAGRCRQEVPQGGRETAVGGLAEQRSRPGAKQ